jgi:hypothetical protein
MKPVQWVTVYRNHYVPIKIVHKQSQYDVQPVSIQVNERIVHYLCDCAPGTANCPHVPTGSPQASAAPQPAPNTGPTVAQTDAKPAATANVANPTNPSARPTAESTAATQAKQWIWLSNENCYGYGYINEQGFAIVDPATKTTNPAVALAN